MPRKKITYTRRSGCSSWFDNRIHSENFMFRILDQTGDSSLKRCVVFLKNVLGSSDSPVRPWLEFGISPSLPAAHFDVLGGTYIEAFFGDTVIPSVLTSSGKQYDTSGTEMFIESTVGGASFSVQNNEEEDMLLKIHRNKRVLWEQTLSQGESQGFQYNPTFWIGILGFGNAFSVSDFNTQMSFLGVATADIIVGKVGDVYTFSLSNVTYA